MAINFNDNLRILKGQPIDSRYFATNGLPYTSTSSVLTQIPLTYRYLGLTVNVNKTEYWFKDDLYTLILKESGTDSSAGGSGVISPSITLAGTSYGSLNDGDTVDAGTSFQTVFEQMFRVSIPPDYLRPILTLSPDDYSVEVGTFIQINLLTSYSQNDGGDASTFTITKTHDTVQSLIRNGLPVVDVSDFSLDQVSLGANLNYISKVTYLEGPIKNDNLGEPYPTGHVTDGSTSDSLTVTGVRAYFYDDDTNTSAPTTSSDIRSLSGKGLNPQNGTTFTINITAGTTRVVFAYPDSLQAVSSVKYVELGNGGVKDTFSLSTVNTEGLNGYTGVDYKVYTFIAAVPFGSGATYNVTI